jgi:hypothetical protein
MSKKKNVLLETSFQTIEGLFNLYDNDLYMTSKIHHYINTQLPTLMENMKSIREKNLLRTEEHTIEQQSFMNGYLGKRNYYYNPTTETYYIYDGLHYAEISEDNILHDIVSSISKMRNPKLMNWKHKTKVSILKRIKENHISKAIPESETIQKVLQELSPSICTSKLESKYLLTILGDNILKKNLSLLHFVSPTVKEFLKCINQFCLEKLHVHCTQTFKYKHHEKHLDQLHECRLVPTATIETDRNLFEIYENMLSNNGLDILCVALHYSRKYSSSDDYIMDKSNNREFTQYILDLKTTTPLEKLQQFIKEYINVYDNEDDHEMEKEQPMLLTSSSPPEESFLLNHLKTWGPVKTLSWGEIQYLWKEFLQNHKLPPNLYQTVYKKLLTETCFPGKYSAEKDAFSQLGSSHIPLIQKFLKFWNETTIEDSSSYVELEIEEITTLFGRWIKNSGKKNQKYLIKESKIVDILSYFKPELEIVDNKYIYHVRNILWDKDMDIEIALGTLKDKADIRGGANITLYDAYLYYCKFHHTNLEDGKKTLLTSKSYFEKYVFHQYGSYLNQNNAFIEDWFD